MFSSTLDHLYFTTGCFNFLLCRFSKALRFNSEFLFEFTVTEDADTITDIFNNTGIYECYGSNFGAIFKAV